MIEEFSTATDWNPVMKEVKIDYYLENNPLYIKTDSELGSGEEVWVYFYDSDGSVAGGINIRFRNPLQYGLSWCSAHYRNLPITPPTTRDKVWKITFVKTAGIRVKIHCNGVKVLDMAVSADTCTEGNWYEYWSRSVEKIKFDSDDAASDYYSLGGNTY